jgi:hypothetical protein
MNRTIRRFHDDVVYAKAPKMSERRIWINIENPSGYYERIQGEIGQSLWDVLRLNRVKIGGFCGGGDLYSLREKPVEPNPIEPDCLLCLVEIKDEWYKKLEIHNVEREILSEQPCMGFNKNRRLACSITIEPWMNEIVLRIPIELPTNESQIASP